MKKILIIVSIFVLSFIGINKLNAISSDVFQINMNNGTIVNKGNAKILEGQASPMSLSFIGDLKSQTNDMTAGTKISFSGQMRFAFYQSQPSDIYKTYTGVDAYSQSCTVSFERLGVSSEGNVLGGNWSVVNYTVITTLSEDAPYLKDVIINGTDYTGYRAVTQCRINFPYNGTAIGIQLDSYTATVTTTIDQGFDELNKNQQETNNKLDDLNNNITDETPPDTGELGNVSGWLPAGPVDSIITLPLNVLQTVSNTLNSSCVDVNLPMPFIEKSLPLPCGGTFRNGVTGLNLFLTTLFTVLGGKFLYNYFVYLYNWVDRILSMEDKQENWGGANV